MARQHRISGIRRLHSANFHHRRCADPKLPVPAEGEHHNTTNTKETAVRHTLRPYATVGVAIVGAGLFAATPVVAPLPDINTIREVALAAGGGLPDLLAPWIDQYNGASENATTLMNNFFLAPGVGLQQMIANMSGYWQDFFNDPTSNTVTEVNTQIQDNLAAVVTGYALQNATSATTATVTEHTLDGTPGLLGSGHGQLFSILPSFLPADQAPMITPIIDFMASPASGIIMGGLGPWISPWIALLNSINAGDGWNETLASMVGAVFNGADLNLDSLLPAINGAGFFPPGLGMTELDIAFGGLLSTGSVMAGPYEVGEGEIPAVGGSIFNSLGLALGGVPVLGSISADSQAIGPLGTWEGLAQTIASLLGWDGSGAPLAGVDLPVIPADVFDAGAAGAEATDLSGLVQDVVAALGF
ncbi:outer membrane porin GjpA [Mycobacterium sp. SMC-14]|uniref:outer membrane porin GjpA n=1 Tax=Mycobacterium sp. SMC-14 TaxID=3385968 RepID=UPI00390C8808